MSPFRLCRAGSAWGLVCRVLGVSMGAASTTTCGHEIPLDQKRGHRSFARIVKQVRICWRQTWLADHTVSKYFCFPSKDLEVNWGNNRLQTINSSNLVLPSCGVHWTSGLLAVSLVIFEGTWLVCFFLLPLPLLASVYSLKCLSRHHLKLCIPQ